MRTILALFTFAFTAALARADAPRLTNLSTRGQVGTGANIMIGGLVIGSGTADTVLIRAVGPGLTQFGVSGVLEAPVLSLYDASGTLLQTNQGWGTGNATAAIMSSVGAFALPAGSADSALVATLTSGSYTAQVSGAGSTTGVVLLEVYEVGATTGTAPLVNLSTRGDVGTGSNIMIPGITVGPGTGTRTLLVRASGPALAALGVTGTLADPTISLQDSTSTTIASNDNWGTPVGGEPDATYLSTVFSQAGAFPFATGSLDAALLAAVQPGAYTVLVNGNNASTGVSLVEVYDVTSSQATSVSIVASKPSADTSGANPGSLTVQRSGDASQAITVSYIVGGTATNGIDYQPLSGSVTLPAFATSAVIPVVPNPTLSTQPSETVSVTLNPGTNYSVGSSPTASVTITNIPPTLYVSQIRPTSAAPGSTGSGVATILLSSDGSMASVSLSFSNLSSDEVVAHLAIGGDTNNGTYVLNLPSGQVTNLVWTPTATGQYSAAQILSALTSGNLFVEIDSATNPGGELGGQFIAGSGSQVFQAPAAPPSIDLSSVTDADAPRFLTQATFGPTAVDIATLKSQGYSAWIANQIAMTPTSHRALTDADFAAYPYTGQTTADQDNRQAAWWSISVHAPDQLRQRVAFALSEIFVVSDVASSLNGEADGLATYYDMLASDAFGNFRKLLQDVTLSPAMGNYLNMLHNAKGNPAKGISADENYAREVQQLFTIGLNKLQPDGTLMLGSDGLPIPTYTQAEIVQTANVFTGWGYYSSTTNPSFYYSSADFDDPMMAYPAYHDETAKTVIGGLVLPANQTPLQDLNAELDALFNHPNTGPFICSQLIQRLVTSNPSPGYVYRVAQVFANDGTGTRGNLAAVIKAILTDYEARSPAVTANAGYGKLKEPIVRITQMYRAFLAGSQEGRFPIFDVEYNIDQAALRSPTVFNFFEPGYVQPGPLASAGLLAPEFQITTATTLLSVPNYFYSGIYTSSSPSVSTVVLNLASLSANSTNPAAMVATLNQLLCGNSMSSATQQAIIAALQAAPTTTTPNALAQMALYLTVTSPDAAVQK